GLLAAARTFVTNLQVTSADRCAAFLPITHVGGIAHVLHALQVGHSLIVSAVFDPERNADLLIDERATLIGSGLPFTNEYIRLSMERGVAPQIAHSRATLSGSSGRTESLSAATNERLGGDGINSGQGATECPYANGGTPDDMAAKHALCEDIRVPRPDIRIVC